MIHFPFTSFPIFIYLLMNKTNVETISIHQYKFMHEFVPIRLVITIRSFVINAKNRYDDLMSNDICISWFDASMNAIFRSALQILISRVVTVAYISKTCANMNVEQQK